MELKVELHPRAIEIAELAAPDACTMSQRLIASQITQAMQQAREQAIDEAAERYARPNMMEGDDLWEYDARAEDAIRALKNKGT